MKYNDIKQAKIATEKAKQRLHEAVLRNFKPGTIHTCYRHSKKGYPVIVCEDNTYSQWRSPSYLFVENLKTGKIKSVWWQELVAPEARGE